MHGIAEALRSRHGSRPGAGSGRAPGRSSNAAASYPRRTNSPVAGARYYARPYPVKPQSLTVPRSRPPAAEQEGKRHAGQEAGGMGLPADRRAGQEIAEAGDAEQQVQPQEDADENEDRKSTRLNSSH